jgi:hypothetical protein
MDNLRLAASNGTLTKVPGNVLRGGSANDVQNNRDVFPLVSAEASVEATWPTFKVHPFIYTGRKTPSNGRALDLVVPLPPFGSYLRHAGAFFGFNAKASTALGQLSQSGAIVATEARQVTDSTVFEIPVAIETVGDQTNPTRPDGGVPPDASTSPCSTSGGSCHSAAIGGRARGGRWALFWTVAVALGLTAAWRKRRRRQASAPTNP